MTIITKPIGEKKGKDEKLGQPLVVDAPNVDAEAQQPKPDFVIRQRYLILTRNALRPSTVTTFYLCMTAFVVMTIGIAGGMCFYRLYLRNQMHRQRSGWYGIPYDSSNKPLIPMSPFYEYLDDVPRSALTDDDLFKSLRKTQENDIMDFLENRNFFRERFELDLDQGYYEKIDVPDFRNGRQGRFIHDFNMNKTGIVDIDGRCCFVMPLNRQRVLPPQSMYDLLQKMYNGYYEVDTGIVRQTMKVITPAITDLSQIGAYIARECNNMTTYLLQPVNSKVYKRSASSSIYGLFAGKNIMEFDIINAQEYTSQNKK